MKRIISLAALVAVGVAIGLFLRGYPRRVKILQHPVASYFAKPDKCQCRFELETNLFAPRY